MAAVERTENKEEQKKLSLDSFLGKWSKGDKLPASDESGGSSAMTNDDMTMMMSPSSSITTSYSYSKRQRWIYQQVAELSRVLGIAIPEVEIAKNRLEAKQMAAENRYTGWTGCAVLKKYKIILAIRGKTFRSVRRIIAHELIHLAFPKLQHGNSFEEYTTALLKGHMAFDRRGLITEVVRPQPTVDTRVAVLVARRKKWETKLKRAGTMIKKIDRKVKHLEKKKKKDEKEEEVKGY